MEAGGTFSWGSVRLSICMPQDADKRSWMTMHHVDSHHMRLLQCSDTSGLVEGLCSVVFWAGLRVERRRVCASGALARLRYLRDGRNGQSPQSQTEVVHLLETMREHLAGHRLDKALTTGLKIKFAGLPIATRLLALMAPDKALPYDTMTAQGLLASRTNSRLYFPVLTSTLGARNRQIAAYESWCSHAINMADRLKLEGACWVDWDFSQNHFQPIDVQRAYEALGSP